MEEQPEQTQLAPPVGAYIPTQADRTIQEWRNDFTTEIRDLRIQLTGKMLRNGQYINVVPGKADLCTQHFNSILYIVKGSSTKGWTLSRLHEESVEKYIQHLSQRCQDSMIAKSYYCEDCGCYRDYDKIQNMTLAIEGFLYGNMNRSVGGYESDKLSSMQSVTRQEVSMQDGRQQGNFFSNLLRRGR